MLNKMKQQKNHSLASVVIALLLICTMAVTAFANADLSGTIAVSGLTASSSGGKDWTASAGGAVWEGTTSSSGGCSPTYTATEGTLVFTNNSGSTQVLSFSYTLSLNSGTFTIDGVSKTSNNSFTKTLNNGDSVTLVAKSATTAANTTKVTLSNIKLEVQQVTVTFKPAANGSYTVDGTAITADKALTNPSTKSYNLNATPAENYLFEGWYFGDTKVSDAATYSGTFASAGNVTAKFVIDPLYNQAAVPADSQYAKSDLVSINSRYIHSNDNSYLESKYDKSDLCYYSVTDPDKQTGYFDIQLVPWLQWTTQSDGSVKISASGKATGEYEGGMGRSWSYANMISDVIRIYAKENCIITFNYSNSCSGGSTNTPTLHLYESASGTVAFATIAASQTTHTNTSGTVTHALAAGKYLYIYTNGWMSEEEYKLSGGNGSFNYSYSASISNVTVEPNNVNYTQSTVFQDNLGNPLSGGKLVLNSVTYNVDSIGKPLDTAGNAATLEFPDGQAMSMSVIAPANYRLLGWKVNGTMHYTPTYAYTLTANAEVHPIFVPDQVTYDADTGAYTYLDTSGVSQPLSGHYIARNPSCTTFYTSLADAFAGSEEVVLLGNMTIKGNFEIPSGEVLVVPCDMMQVFTKNGNEYQPIMDTTMAGVKTYATLTLNGNMTVNGALLLSGHQYAPNGGHYCIQSAMNLAGSSTVTVSAGSALYSYGYINGTGTIYAKGSADGTTGATIHEFCELPRIPHPQAMQGLAESQNVMPLNAYYLNSIRAKTSYEVGTRLQGHFAVSYDEITTAALSIIGPSNSCFTVTSGTVTKYFNPNRGQIVLRVDENSSADTNSISLSITAKLVTSYTLEMDSSKVVLPLANGYRLETAGQLNVKHMFKLLPGAEVDVEETGTLEIVDNGKLIFYRLNDYDYRVNSSTGSDRMGFNIGGYPINVNGYSTFNISNVGSAKLNVDGRLITNGKLYVTESLIDENLEPATETPYKYFKHYENGFNFLTGSGTIEAGTPATQSTIKEYHVSNGDHAAAVVNVTIVSMKGLKADADADIPENYVTLSGTVCGYINDNGVNVWSDNPCAEGHDFVLTEAKAATCTEDGNIAYNTCSRCKGIFAEDGVTTLTESDLVISATDHTPGAEATCENAQTCTICGAELAPALGHDESGEWQDDGTNHYQICGKCNTKINVEAHSGGTATCVAKKVCTTCNKEYGETDTTDGHSFSTDWTTDGTNHWHACLNEGCTGKGSEGKHEGGTANCKDQAVCSICQTPYGKTDSNNHKSVKTDAAVAATCEAAGLTEGSHCEACNTTITAQKEVPALGHEEGAAATCTTAQTCTRCSHVFTEALGHSYTNYVSNNDAKCEVDGTKTAKCDRCDETSTIPDEGSKLGHSYTQYVSNNNATCQTNATETASCDNGCGGKDTRPIADSMVDHSYGEYFSDNNAACLKDGTKTAKCIWCENTDTVTDTGSALRHSFTNYVSDGNATCMTDGTKTAKCDNNCGETSTITDAGSALGHSFTNYVPDGNETCAYEGTETAKCDRCDAADTRDATGVQLKPHTFTNYVYNNDATCFADGTKTAHCDVCNTATDEIIAEGTQLTHSYSNYVSNKDATCTQDGTKSALCDHNCGTKDTIADTGSKLGHSFTNFVSNGDATCTANGTETAKCDRCEEKMTQEDADSILPHSFTQYESNNDATCTADGTETAKCDNCDATHTRTQAGSMKDHEMGQWVEVTPAGCTTKGVERQDCENCDYFETKETDALGHNMGAWVTTNAPTCIIDGEERSDCDRCDYYETKVLKSNGHDYRSEVTLEPTCVAKGTETYTCSKCQDTYTKELAETGDHTEATREENRVEATCGADGSYVLVTYCSVCDAVIQEEQKTIPATGAHTYEPSVTKEPTCIAVGEKTYTCSGCDASYTEEMAIVEHQVSDSYTTEDGKHFQACLTEGCSYKENEAVCSDAEGDGDHSCDVCEAPDVSGHTESEPVVENYKGATCTSAGSYDSVVRCAECNAELSRTPHTVSQSNHDFGAWEIITNATCTTDGSQKRACTVCGHEETSSIPATGHEVYNNGFCAVCDAYQPAVQNAEGIYEIGNAGQLYWFAAQVDGDFENFGSANAILTDNITIPATKSQDATSKIPDWDPIGYYDSATYKYQVFSGTFDGNDKTISGLYVVNTAETFAGMFEQNNGTIRNLTLTDVSIISSATNVGGIAGYSSGSISGCSVSGSIKPDDDYDSTNYRGGIAGGNAGIIENCSCSATITGTSNYCGGIVASNRKTVTNCTFSGTVNGEDVGGIAADNQDYGIITDCINEGSVTGMYYAGGIVGNNVGIIENCRNSGSCVVTESTTNKPGAIAAAHYNIGRHGSLAAIRNCYNTADLPLVGTTRCSDLELEPVTIENCHNYSTSGFGIAGYASGTVITNCYYLAESETDSLEGTTFKTEAQFASGEVAYLLNGGSAEGVWKQTIGTDAYPTFAGATVYKNQTGGCTADTFTYAYSNTRETDVINHSWVEATCTQPTTCSACGATDGEKLGHSFTNYVPNNDATCTADGTKTAKCDRCGAATDTVTNEGSMLKHSFLNYVSDNNATCTKNGTETAKCEGCEETDTREDVDSMLDHAFTVEQSRTPATCKEEGSITWKCVSCDATTVETLAIDPSNHVEIKYEDAKAPSCTESGYEAYEYCTECDYTTRKEVAHLGHKPGAATEVNRVESSCSVAGSYESVVSCSVCGTEISRETVKLPLAEHSWEDATYDAPKMCSKCGTTEGSKLQRPAVDMVAPETVVPSVPENAEIAKDAAEEAVNSLVSSANNVAQPVTGIESDGNVDSLGAAKQQIKDENQNVIAGSSYETSLIITLNAVVVDQEGSNVVAKKVTFDVSPMLYAINELGIKVGETKITAFDEPITFHLPVDKNSTAAFARVWHMDTEDLGLHKIQTDADGNRFVEVKAKNFSNFTLELEEPISDSITVAYSMQAFLTLEAEVFMNVGFTLDNLNGINPETLMDRVGLLMWDGGNAPLNDADVNIGLAELVLTDVIWNASKNRFEVRTDGIPAKEMGDKLDFCAYYIRSDGSYVYGRVIRNYCPSKYCYGQLKDADTRDDALMIALLNYGASAQKLFNYRTDDLMNKDLTAAQQSINWDSNLVRSDWSIPAAKEGALARNTNIITSRGGYLTLLGAIDYNYYIKVSNSIQIQSIKILCWTEQDYNANAVLTPQNASSVHDMEWLSDKNRYEFKYAGLAAKDMFSPIYTCAMVEDVDGNVYYGGIVPYCPERYAYINVTSSTATAADIEAAKCMVIYGDAARSYFYG